MDKIKFTELAEWISTLNESQKETVLLFLAGLNPEAVEAAREVYAPFFLEHP